MRYIHPAALIGLFLNVALGLGFFLEAGHLDLKDLGLNDMQMQNAVQHFIELLRVMYVGMLALQALALGMLVSRISAGVWLAGFATLFLLPVSLVYFIGILLTHNRIKYGPFTFAGAPATMARPHMAFAAYARKKLALFSGINALLFLFLFTQGSVNPSLIFLGLALAGLALVLRCAKFHALALYDDHFTLLPGALAFPLRIPYDSVRIATLLADQSIQFQMDAPGGVRLLTWSLSGIDPRERRQALEELGAALAAQNVPLQ